MDQELEAFRAWIAEQRKTTAAKAVRYPAEKRTWVAEYTRRRLAAGGTLGAVRRELGISDPAIRRFLAASGDQKPATAFRAVEINSQSPAPEPRPINASGEARTITLVTPRGFRIEGLDAASAMALVRELG